MNAVSYFILFLSLSFTELPCDLLTPPTLVISFSILEYCYLFISLIRTYSDSNYKTIPSMSSTSLSGTLITVFNL